MAKSTNISVQNGSGYLIVGETPRADVCRSVQRRYGHACVHNGRGREVELRSEFDQAETD